MIWYPTGNILIEKSPPRIYVSRTSRLSAVRLTYHKELGDLAGRRTCSRIAGHLQHQVPRHGTRGSEVSTWWHHRPMEASLGTGRAAEGDGTRARLEGDGRRERAEGDGRQAQAEGVGGCEQAGEVGRQWVCPSP